MRKLILFLALAFGLSAPAAAEQAFVIPPPAVDSKPGPGLEKAVLAGGCFWGVQGVFQHVKGVTRAVSGYSGGQRSDANYKAVSAGGTGHAEAVEIMFDPKVISYGRILQIYFSVAHNPTQLNYQGPDRGKQYRSHIFTTNDEQKKIAGNYIAQLDKSGKFGAPIVTRIDPLKTFYAAEAYHQDYMTRHPTQPYIAIYDLPKVENLKKLFPSLAREKPVLLNVRA